jgi:glucose/arabinose dehydrogenase
MTKKSRLLLTGIICVIAGILILRGGIFYWKNLRGVGPAINPPAGDIVEELEPGMNSTGFPLKLPDGFSIEIFAKNLPGARVMEFDGFGNMWVSQTSRGEISLLEIGDDGKVNHFGAVFRNLVKPHGLAFDPEFKTLLYIAEENKISKVPTYSDGGMEKIADLPSGGGHFTRTLGIGPDKRLYVSIGSSCNVCHEDDPRRAAIYSMNPDGSDFKQFAKGLRNSVFFTWRDGKMWATEMGRDLLGDDVPPEEINIIEEGKNYGWPNCYGKNIHDDDFDRNTYIRNPCMEPFETGSKVDLQAHSAPLGLAFVPDSWPNEYRGDLIVAFHGSWNRSVPTGYKLVRIKLDSDGNYSGIEDFITGWYEPQQGVKGPEGALGRPVDVKFGPDGNLYVSDDKAGVIYRIWQK